MIELLKLAEKEPHQAIVYVVSTRDFRFFLSMKKDDERGHFRGHTSFITLFPHRKSVHLTPYPEYGVWRLSLFSRRDIMKKEKTFLKKWTITDIDDDERFVLYFKEVN